MPTAAKPSDEEIARRRAEKAERKKHEAPKKPQEPRKKVRDVAGENAALREWGVGHSLIDIGANLQQRLSFEAVSELSERASLAGVDAIVLTGCDIEGSRKGIDYAERHPRLYATVGVHPHDAKEWNEGYLEEIRTLSKSKKCVALGEAGLDYDRMLTPRQTQLDVFRTQADLAVELGFPLFVHCRESDEEYLGAYEDVVRVLTDSGIDPRKCCVHCFTGNLQQLDKVLDFGAFVGLTGFVGIAKRNGDTLQALRSRPDILDRLMCETDSPFMLPDKTWLPNAQSKRLGLRGGRNEPAVLPAVCRAIAEALGNTDPRTVAEVTTRNARHFFSI